MRKLEPLEIEKIQLTVSHKGICIVELLAEIYDHYISHLEQFSKEEFEQELKELDNKFTPKYCRKMEKILLDTSKKDILRLLLKQIPLMLTLPKAVLSLTIVLVLGFFWTSLEIKQQMMAFIALCGATLLLTLGIWWQSHQKIKGFKTFYKGEKLLISVHFSNIALQLYLPVSIFTLSVTTPKILGFYNIIDTPYFFLVSMVFFLVIAISNIGVYQVWKVKSKAIMT